ncbi:unnamed protein product, partial [Closterium sp. NIES-54]
IAVDSGAARGAASGGAASWRADSRGAEPGGAEFEGAGSGGAEPGGEEPGGAESAGVESGGAEPEGVEPGGAESGGAEPRGATSSIGRAGASPRLSPWSKPLSPQQLRKWFTQRTSLRSGATGARDSAAGDTGGGGAGDTAGAGGPGAAAAAGLGGARTRGTGAAGTGSVGGAGARDITEPGAIGAGGTGAGGTSAGGAGGAGAGGARAVGTGAGGTGAGGAGARGAGAVDRGAGGAGAGVDVSGGTGAGGTPTSALPARSPYTEQAGGLTERREPASRPASPVRTGRRVPRPRPPLVPSTHAMALRPSSVPLRVPLPPPPESSLLAVPDPDSDRAHAASPTVSRLLATALTDPSFESTAASALVGELVDFAAACRLDYATALVAESGSASPPSVRAECALGMDVLEDRQEDFEYLAAAVPRFTSMLLAHEGDSDAPDIPTPRSYAEAITGPYSSQWEAAMDAEMASWKSTGTYVDAVPQSRSNIVDGMWIFSVKWPPRSPPCLQGFGVAAGAGVTGGTAATGPGGARTRGTGAAGTGGVEGAGAGDPTESGATGARGSGAGGAGAGGAGVGGTGTGGAGVGGTGVGGAGAGGAGAVDPGGAVRPRPYFPASPLPAPSPYTEQSGGLTERRESASRPVSPVRTARRVLVRVLLLSPARTLLSK